MGELNRFVLDMPNEEYHKYKGISKSGLDKIDRSPAHYKFREYKDPTRAMAIGTAIHTAVLEPERFKKEYCITEAKVRTAKPYKDAKAIHGGELTLTEPEGKKVTNMQKAVESNPIAMELLEGEGNAETSAICTDPETGVIIRARYDWINNDGIVIDLKKTQDVRKFAKSVFDYRYHVQEAMYSFIYELITGEPLKAFYFLAVEEEAPHSNEMFLLDDTAREIGQYYFRKNLRAYAECVNSGNWPHPDCADGIIELPNWAITSYENDLEVII